MPAIENLAIENCTWSNFDLDPDLSLTELRLYEIFELSFG